MKSSNATVASQHRLLYGYVGVSVCLEIIFTIIRLHTKQVPHHAAGISTHAQDIITWSALAAGGILFIATQWYLLASKKAKNIAIILKIILTIQILASLIGLKQASFSVILTLFEAGLTYVVLRDILRKPTTTVI